MRFKNKKHIIIPIAIVIYTIAIAIYAATKYYTPDTKISFFIVIGLNLVLAIILYFIFKKREDLRKNNKK